MNNHEITALVYDSLMGNDEIHPQIDLNKVESQEVEEHRGRISFNYEGYAVNISIKSEKI
jgi:hypothetical protein